ncbi:MAG: MATE family efflux transporter [Sphingomonas fennica]
MSSAAHLPVARPGPAPWYREARALMALSLPLIAGNVAWGAIAATDLLLIGRLGADAVGAGALGINLHTAFLIFGMGLASAAAPLIAQERGARRHAVRELRRSVRQTIWACAMLCVPCWAILWQGEAILVLLGQDRALSAAAGGMLRGLQWALLPYLVFLVLRNFLSALERPLWGVVVMAAAVPFNALAGWALIFGHFGLPALGLFGAGLASTLSCTFMAVALMAALRADRHLRRYHVLGNWWRADRQRLAAVWRIGLPIAITLGLEVTVFNAAVLLMGLIGRTALAAHAVAIQITMLAFMVPTGIGQAATVRVGLSAGRGDAAGVRLAGWTALAIGTGFALAAAAVLVGAPRPLIAAFLDPADPANAPVIALAAALLAVAALFQLVDCTQAIAAGMLRGLQDTRVPMLIAGFGYWVVGIGAGVALAFPAGLGGVGIWLGLASGLATVALLLIRRWHRREALGLIPPPPAIEAEHARPS